MVIIPARLHSTRLPNKPLALLGGVPLVVRTAQQALKCSAKLPVWVATDAPAIADAVRSFGLTAHLTSQHHPSGTDRIWETVKNSSAQYIINVQADEPFIHPEDITALAHALSQHDCDMATLKRPLHDDADRHNPNVVKVVCNDQHQALYFSRAAIPHARNPGDRPAMWHHLGVYAYRRTALARLCASAPHPLEICEGLEQLRALAMGLRITVLPAQTHARGIDTPEDLAWAQQRVQRLGEAAFS